jgi:hypothetical protein
LRADGSEKNAGEEKSRLMAAADAGNLSAQILYTLLYTNIKGSPFLREIERNSSYSRYADYISGLDVLTFDPYAAERVLGTAAEDGVVEAHLLLHIAAFVKWRSGGWSGDRDASVFHMLVVERFYPDSTIRPYLRRLLSVSDAEIEASDRFASLRVADILSRKEVRHCDLDKRCAADSNIKRLICDIRTPKGESLLELEPETCSTVSAPLVLLYHNNVAGVIRGIIRDRRDQHVPRRYGLLLPTSRLCCLNDPLR